MRNFIIILILLVSINIDAQVNNTSNDNFKVVSFGLNVAYTEILKDSPAAISIGVDYSWFHVDYSRQFAKSRGEYSTKADHRIPWKQTNVGVNIQLHNTILTPKIGYMELGYDEPEFNFGLDIKFISDDGKTVGFGLGLKSVVMMNIGIPL